MTLTHLGDSGKEYTKEKNGLNDYDICIAGRCDEESGDERLPIQVTWPFGDDMETW